VEQDVAASGMTQENAISGRAITANVLNKNPNPLLESGFYFT